MHNATDQGIGVSMLFSSEVMDPGSQTRDDAWTYEALPISADDVQTELWTADFLNRRVTIKVEAQPDITPAELAEAHVIIKSMRSEPTDASPFRLTFTLPGGWDSG